MLIEFPHCTVEWLPRERKCITRFPDGTEAHAIPHSTPAYHKHAIEKSTGDVDDYCWQHEVFHNVYGLMNGGVSRVLWAIAHGESAQGPEFDAEEEAVQEMQRKFFLRE